MSDPQAHPNPVAEIEASVLALNSDTDPTTRAETINRVGWLMDKAKEIKRLMDEALLEILTAEDGPREFEVGGVRFYAGNKSKTVCRDNQAALMALLDHAGGDFTKVADCLSASGLKHGACRTVLGEEYEQHFETVTELDVKTGKPKKQVKADNGFRPKGGNSHAA